MNKRKGIYGKGTILFIKEDLFKVLTIKETSKKKQELQPSYNN